jgi:CheY-like chemotaxis protein
VVRRDRFCQVDTVSSGQAALEQLRVHAYDLILSDLRMPEMDGPTFIGGCKSSTPTT